MTSMLTVEIKKARGEFEFVERKIPAPSAQEVLVKVEACGICRGDDVCRQGFWPGMTYPRVPGHEAVGIIEAVGSEVTEWKKGQRVGAGWYAGHCKRCSNCRRGQFNTCEKGDIHGIFRDGGYSQYMLASEDALVAIPDGWSATEVAPLLCAGVSTFSPLRNSGARAGELVAIQGIGGLGHLAVQFAQRMGFRVVAISSGSSKHELASKLGAHHYIDASKSDPAKELQALGGAALILATAPDATSIGALVEGLKRDGKMIIVAAPHDKVQINSLFLLKQKASIMGWPGGSPADVADTLAFATMTGIKPMVETFALKDADKAYQHMESNKVRFRCVLDCTK